MTTAKWMVHPESRMVMGYNDHLVKEQNYIPYNGPLPVISKETGVRTLSEGCEFETVDEKELMRLDKEAKEFEKHKVKILEAMKEMPKIEFITNNGMPKLTALEKACGFKPTLEERAAAFNEFRSEQKEV